MNLRDGPGLETVTDLVLVRGAEHIQTPPIERFTGPRAVRAGLQGELLEFQAAEDTAGERECCLELASRLFEEELAFDDAVRLTERALEISDDATIRGELAAQLVRTGRYVAAADALAGGGQAGADGLLAAAQLYARAGDQQATVRVLEQAAELMPDDPGLLEHLATVLSWTPEEVSADRAADAWLAAAARHPPDSEAALVDVARAFDAAPDYLPAAASYAEALQQLGRVDVADEVLRAQAASDHASDAGLPEMTHRRIEAACEGAVFGTALGAALDASFWAPVPGESRNTPILRLLKRPEVNRYLHDDSTTRRRIRSGLTDVARTRTRMGRAATLIRLARRLHADGRGLLLAIAAESYAEAGNQRRARETARLAVRAAPWSVRALSTLLMVAAAEDLDAATLEKAVALLPARAAIYRALAHHLEVEGAQELAFAWTRRWLEHTAGGASACQALLRRAVQSRGPECIVATVEDVSTVAVPLATIGATLAAALRSLAGLDTERALGLGRWLLDEVGTGEEVLCDSLSDLATQADDLQLELRLVTRRAASEQLAGRERAHWLLRATELSLDAGHAAAAAANLCQAAANAADLNRLDELLERTEQAVEGAPEQQRSDCLISIAHARAWAAEQRDARSAAAAWRHLAAMRWDLAADRIGAEEAYFLACQQELDRGPYRYAADLSDRAGPEDAVDLITTRASRLYEDHQRGLQARLLTAAGRLAADHGLFDRALELSVQAIQTDPTRSDAVAVVEKVADGDEGIEALNLIYDILGSSALGRFGRRAAHYRAARQLEQRGAYHDALRHAVAAFEAVPSEGASYSLLLRLAGRCEDEAEAVRSIASVAVTGPSGDRISWLQRAAALASGMPNGPELRFDLFLNAFGVDPSGETVEMLGEAMEDLLRHAPDHQTIRDRFEEAVRAALPKMKGPRGAYTAIGLAQLSTANLGHGALACAALERALKADPNGGGFEPFMHELDVLVAGEDAALSLLRAIMRRQDSGFGLDPSLETLGAGLTNELGEKAEQVAAEFDTGDEVTQPDGRSAAQRMAEAVEAPPTVVLPTTPEPEPEPEPERRADTGPYDERAEAQARAHGDHEMIATILAARAGSTDNLERRRLIRLRRAAVLEQRLGRLEEAARELEAILEEVGDDPTALRYLADLRDRAAAPVEAAALWLRAAHRARTESKRLADLTRCCDSLVASGDPEAAREVFAATEDLPASPALLQLRAQLAQKLGEPAGLAAALNELTRTTAQPDEPAVAVRVQPVASRADSAATPTPSGALAATPRTSSSEPDNDEDSRTTDVAAGSGNAVLEACRLDYRLRGAGTPNEAQRTIDRLERLRGELSPEQRDLHAFLVAEALDAVEGEDAAVEELETHVRQVGASPLVAIALAERLVRRRQLAQAVPLYERALQPGAQLWSVRSAGQVSLEAAGTAKDFGSERLARAFLERAADEDESQALARERLDAWFPVASGAESEPSEAPHEAVHKSSLPPPLHSSLPPPLDGAASETESSVPADDESAVAAEAPPPEPVPSTPAPATAAADRSSSEPSPSDPSPARLARAGLRASGTMLSEADGATGPAASTVPSQPDPERISEPAPAAPTASSPPLEDPASEPEPELAQTTDSGPPPPQNLAATLESPAPVLAELAAEAAPSTRPSAPPTEANLVSTTPPLRQPRSPRLTSRPELSGPEFGDLYRDLVNGSFQSGEYLLALFEAGAIEGRSGEILTVRLHQAHIRRGDATVLARLEQAARDDHNTALAHAVHNVLHAFDEQELPEPPPPLNELAPQPELTSRLLFSDLATGANEALGIVCESGMLRRDMSAYGLSGTHRVAQGTRSAVGHVYTMLSQLLDVRGTRLFHTTRSGPLRTQVALLSPFATILEGEADEETPALLYELGRGLAASMPPCALVEGLQEQEVRDVLTALLAGFGPVGAVTETSAEQMRLAEDMWHVVSPAAERRLREICDNPEELTFLLARRKTEQACRRAGLFASGDFGTALARAIDELGIEVRTPLSDPGGLVELCGHPAVADLFDLATTPEYAEARWYRAPPSVLSRTR